MTKKISTLESCSVLTPKTPFSYGMLLVNEKGDVVTRIGFQDDRVTAKFKQQLKQVLQACTKDGAKTPTAPLGEVPSDFGLTTRFVPLSANEIDDMAFAYVPSGKIGELREFADALLQTFKDKLGLVPVSDNQADTRNAILEEAAKACEARIKNPDPKTWGMSYDAAYDAEDMACAEAIRKLKTKPVKTKKGKA